jgi:hypothetical protein
LPQAAATGLRSVDVDSLATQAPTEDEAVAIAAAIEALWPRQAVTAEPEGPPTLAWRFSGRWWQRDRLAGPERPWR